MVRELLVVAEEVHWSEADLEACSRTARAVEDQEGRGGVGSFLSGLEWAL